MARSASLLVASEIAAIALLATSATRLLAQDSATAFVDVSVVTMEREQVLAHQTVVVRAGRIVALGSADQVTPPVGARRVDGRGMFLIPGLGDMHVHLAQGGSESGADTTVDAASQLFPYIAAGVTTVRDMHSGRVDPWFLTLRGKVAAGTIVGPRMYGAGDPDEASPEAAAKSIAMLKAAGYDFVKLYGRLRPLYDSIVGPARRVGLRVVGHTPPLPSRM